MLYLKYGSYSHELAEASVVIDQKRNFNDEGVLEECVNTWQVTGVLQADDVASLTTAINDMERAYLDVDVEVAIRTQNGFTSHRLRPSDWDSIRCVALGYPVGNGAEYTTYRTYALTIEAKRKPNGRDGGDNILEFSQSIEMNGDGGPDWVFQPVTSGDWPAATLTEKTPVTITQSGTALGQTRYVWATPLFPASEKGKLRRLLKTSPQKRVPEASRFQSSWSYTFEFMGGYPQFPDPTYPT